MLFFESGDIEVFKADRNNQVIASNEKQIDVVCFVCIEEM